MYSASNPKPQSVIQGERSFDSTHRQAEYPVQHPGSGVYLALGRKEIMRLLVVISILLLSGCGLSSEHTLRQNFAAHESEIQQILRMQQHDSKVVRVAPTFTRLKDNWAWPRKDIGFSEQRWNQYRELFKAAGITDGTQVDASVTFLFVSSAGLGIAGSSRGYAYTLSTPSVVVGALSKCPHKNGVCFVPLQGHWYLFQWVT